MGLSKKVVRLIIGLMVISLTGLVGLQASLLKSAWELKENSFRRNVQAALGAVVEGLEVEETTYATMRVVGDAASIVVASNALGLDSCLAQTDNNSLSPGREITVTVDPASQFEALALQCDSAGIYLEDSSDTTVLFERHLPRLPLAKTDTSVIMFQYATDSARVMVRGTAEGYGDHGQRHLIDSGRVDLISRVMDHLVAGQRLPIEERIDAARLDSLVSQSLNEYGITLQPAYGVIVRGDSSLHLQRPEGFAAELLASEYQTNLYPNDILAAPNSLAFFFPERGLYLLKQIGPLLALTIMFMAVVVFGFGYSLRTILAQQRTARQMVDFVNNMTHEFKTPISTVALACEAILRPDVISDAAKVTRFSNMIQDENRRMRHQTETILQMAALEEKQGKLKLAWVDVHEVIQNAVDSIALQVDGRGGRIDCNLAAGTHRIPADEVHLTGIIYNLLDNANKYSTEAPRISIRTEDHADGICITIRDRGIGLSENDAGRIFDKYFRVPRGNVHDVKGFGLGLSYVNLMVKAHGGFIKVHSKPGEGTAMEVVLPIDGFEGSDYGEVP